jgi:hypothetical protein
VGRLARHDTSRPGLTRPFTKERIMRQSTSPFKAAPHDAGELRAAVLSLWADVAEANRTDPDVQVPGADAPPTTDDYLTAIERRNAAEEALLAILRSRGLAGVVLQGRLYATFMAEVDRTGEFLNHGHALDLDNIARID